jgi:hypothetical protein
MINFRARRDGKRDLGDAIQELPEAVDEHYTIITLPNGEPGRGIILSNQTDDEGDRMRSAGTPADYEVCPRGHLIIRGDATSPELHRAVKELLLHRANS